MTSGTSPAAPGLCGQRNNPPKETAKSPRSEPDLLPEEHSESATRGLWLSGQRRTT